MQKKPKISKGRTRYMKKIGFLFALIFLLVGCSNTSGEGENSEGFKLGNISTSEFKDNESYFIVMPFEWNGEDSVSIEAIEMIKDKEEPVNVDNDRIIYEFHGADVNKKTGVYERESIGDVEDIRGFEVEGESRLVLEVSLTNVIRDSTRKIKIKYLVGEEKKEQIIESTTIENLRTKK